MLSPFDDEIISHESTRLDRYEKLPSAPPSGGSTPVIWAGNLATVTVSAEDEPVNTMPLLSTQFATPKPSNGISWPVFLGLALIVVILVKK